MSSVRPRNVAPVVLLLSLVWHAGCGGEAPEPAAQVETASQAADPIAAHRLLTEESLRFLEELDSALAGVVDEASAVAARPALEVLGETMQSLVERRGELGEPPAELAADPEFTRQHLALLGLWNGFLEHLIRLQEVPGAAAALGEPLDTLARFFGPAPTSGVAGAGAGQEP